jgi:hypothetical protein
MAEIFIDFFGYKLSHSRQWIISSWQLPTCTIMLISMVCEIMCEIEGISSPNLNYIRQSVNRSQYELDQPCRMFPISMIEA